MNRHIKSLITLLLIILLIIGVSFMPVFSGADMENNVDSGRTITATADKQEVIP
jgi:hypothetical protein